MNARRLAPAGVLAAAALVVAATPAERPRALRAPLAQLPASIGGFGAVDDTVSQAELAQTQHPEYLMRRYERAGQVGMALYVGYYASRSGREGYHSPQECLPGAGWEPLEQGIVRVRAGGGEVPVHRYLVGRGAQRALVFYWFQGRGRVTADEWATKAWLLSDAVVRRRSEEAFVRLVLPMPAAAPGRMGAPPLSDPRAADALAREAIGAVVPALAGVLPAP